jgi:hypothetical protein
MIWIAPLGVFGPTESEDSDDAGLVLQRYTLHMGTEPVFSQREGEIKAGVTVLTGAIHLPGNLTRIGSPARVLGLDQRRCSTATTPCELHLAVAVTGQAKDNPHRRSREPGEADQ